jgi:hypothetical protein
MLTATQQFRLGLGNQDDPAAKFPVDLPALLAALAAGEIVETSNLPAIAGFVSAERSRDGAGNIPDIWKTDPGASLLADFDKVAAALHTPEGQTPAYNDFFLGRFACGGSAADLLELIRRARHRDGSTSSIVLGSATHLMLASAAADIPELAGVLKSKGLDLDAMQTGDFPPDYLQAATEEAQGTRTPAAPGTITTAASVVTPEPRWIGGRMVGGPQAPAKALATVPETVSGYYGSAHDVKADEVEPSDNDMGDDPMIGSNAAGKQLAGWNLQTGIIRMFQMRLTPTAALAALQSLVVATQNVLIPHEGYAWLDEMEQAGSTLVCVDKWLADRVRLPERSGELAQRMGVDTVWLQGSITQSKEDGPQFGHYKAVLQHGSGGAFEEFGDFLDLNDAKFALAKKVRGVLASPAN